MRRWIQVTTSSTVWLASRGTSYVSNLPSAAPRQMRTVSDASLNTPSRGRGRLARLFGEEEGRRPVDGAAPCSCALIELGQHELAMTERLGRRQAPVAGADHDVDEAVARLVERHLAPQDARAVEVDV